MREAPGCSLPVDHHPTDGVEVERALGRLAFTDCGEELDRLANVSQRLPTAWLVEDAFKLRCERGGVCREQDSPPVATADTRAARLTVAPK